MPPWLAFLAGFATAALAAYFLCSWSNRRGFNEGFKTGRQHGQDETLAGLGEMVAMLVTKVGDGGAVVVTKKQDVAGEVN